MFKFLNQDVMGGLVRHLLTLGGGALVARGYIDEATASQLIGGGIALFGVVWSVAQKQGAR